MKEVTIYDQPLEWRPLERDAMMFAEDIAIKLNLDQYPKTDQNELKKHIVRFARRMIKMTDDIRERIMDEEPK